VFSDARLQQQTAAAAAAVTSCDGSYDTITPQQAQGRGRQQQQGWQLQTTYAPMGHRVCCCTKMPQVTESAMLLNITWSFFGRSYSL
jgi:hypothetical protein